MTSGYDKNKIKKSPQKDLLLKETLKTSDRTKIPDDEKFYESMHNDIMSGIEATEIKNAIKWSQPFVFLEPGIATAEIQAIPKLPN